MLRQFGYVLCAAVVGFAGHGAVSVAPACDHCDTCIRSPMHTRYAAPTGVRYRWVSVYENGRVRLVPRAYRVRVSDPAQATTPPSTITPGYEGPAPHDQASAVPTPPNTVPEQTKSVPPNPVPPNPAPPGRGPANASPSSSTNSDRSALANRAQALLQAKCVRCHGEQRRSAGLNLSSRESILKGGASGPAVVPGQPDESLVLERVRAGEMPPGNAGRLSPQEVATLQQWIAGGAQ